MSALSVTTLTAHESRENWELLSPFDPTLRHMEHERALVAHLLSQGASALVVQKDNQPLARTLFFPMNPTQRLGSLGLFAFAPNITPELKNSACDSLFAEASRLARTTGLDRLLAPMNGLTWFDYRLRTDSHNQTFDWEPPRNPILLEQLLRRGFTTDTEYRSIACRPLTKLLDDTSKDSQRCLAEGYLIKEWDADFMQRGGHQTIYKLSIEGFSSNSYFCSIPFAAFRELYITGKKSVQSHAAVAYDRNGECIGYMYTFLEPLADALVLKTGAIDRSHRGKGLSNAMIRFICEELLARKPENYISALVMRGLGSESYSKHGQLLWEHKYELLGVIL